ncbi:MAG: S9 family peptidase [Terriglobales bacterium]|jgi:dipeptidyl aminopeptidase/acylaminoacyl peptidase
MRRLAFLLALLFSLPAFSQAKHPFTFEDMMKLKRVGEPVPSPDGKWVLFSAVDVDLAANTKTPHIWIVPLNADSNEKGVPHPSPEGRVGGTERVLIPDQDGDRPRWAPDGKRFAFLSTKEGESQVWIADFDGTAGTVTSVHKLTSIATEAGGELWSPDGKHILFTSDVYPECDGAPAVEAACNAKKVKDAADSKVKALIFDRLLYRHWNAYKAGKRSHIFVVAAPTLPSGEGWGTPVQSARDITPGDYDSPEFSLGGQDDYAFSPDGQEICYTSNHDKVEATSTNNDLWIVPVNWPANATPAEVLAKTKNITADNPASDSTPLYSPDGKYIAYRAQQRPGYESDRFRLMLYDRKTGERKNLTEGFDGWVGTFTWGASRFLFFTAEEAGSARIYYTSLDFVKPSVVKTALQGYDDDLTFVQNNNITFLLFSKMSISAPTEIYKSPWVLVNTPHCGETGGDICSSQDPNFKLTHLNDAVLSQIAMSPLEPFWFTGAHGDKVEGFLVKPPNFDASKKYPVKFLIHGGPQGAWGDDWSYRWNPELFAANGYVVIMINFHGSTGYGQKFIDAINGDWGGAPFEDLMKGLDYAEAHYGFIDKDRECALGASFGGYMANWVLGHTDRFKCIVSHDGTFNNESDWGTTEELWFNEWEFHGTPYTNRELYRKWSPHLFATNFKTPTLVIHGQLDYRLDVSEGFQLFTTLQRLGVPSKMLYFPDEGHWVLKPQNSQLWYKTVNDWVDRWTRQNH